MIAQTVSKLISRWPVLWRPPLVRPALNQLAQLPRHELPTFVQESAAALKYLELLGGLAWDEFPEADPAGPKRGPKPAPRAPFVAAYLIKVDKGLKSMPKLCEYLIENPAVVWILGFELQPSRAYRWGFDVAASLSQPRHYNRILRKLRPDQLEFLLQGTVHLIRDALPTDVAFGNEVSLDTKHIVAWVKENNPKEFIKEGRFDKTKQPAGDPDCKLGCKRRHNKRESQPTHDGAENTPTQEGIPATNATVGEYYWGYASGVVATKVPGYGEVVLAEYTQTFDRSDVSYFQPLMAQTERTLGFAPPFGALDAAFDAFYVYEYFHAAGGFAAVPWADRADHRKTFNEEGLPLCGAGLPMPRKGSFQKKSHCLVPHECARYACPLRFPEQTADACPIDHAQWPKGGCTTTLPTSPGNQIRHELDRDGDAYKQLFKQRTATERINALAVDLGIERPKLRNQRSIAHNCTLIYVLLNLRTWQRIRMRSADPALT